MPNVSGIGCKDEKCPENGGKNTTGPLSHNGEDDNKRNSGDGYIKMGKKSKD